MFKVMIESKRTGATEYVYVNSLKEIDFRSYIILGILWTFP